MGINKRRTPPARPFIVWAATTVVFVQCFAVPIGLAFQVAGMGLTLPQLFFVLTPTLLATTVLACQAIAVFRREWIGSWLAASVVSFAFVLPGAYCFFLSPLMLQGGGPIMTFPKPFVAAGVGFWGALLVASGLVMGWWATRLYRWRVLRRPARSSPVRVSEE